MAIKKFWVMAYRDLGRNRRRSIFTLIAVALGLALIIVLNGFISGVLESSLQNNIRLNTGHLQMRAAAYDEEKLDLLELIDNPQAIAAQVQEMAEVETATPVLWTSGVLSTIQESTGLRAAGIDPSSPFHDPIRDGLVAGEFLTADSRGEILVGQRLAENMGIGVGQRVSLAVGTASGQPDEGIFTVKGLFNTGFPSYDDNTVFISLPQAQAFTHVGEQASSIIIMLHQQDDTAKVAERVAMPGITLLTWEELNAIVLQTATVGMNFYIILYAIVILVVAVVIANTLLMSVFERIREIGILAALGMKGGQIMLLILFEAAVLALVGIVIGIAVGSAGVAYLAAEGIYIGEASASMTEGFAIGTTMYARYVPANVISLSIWMLAIILLVSLYPARYAARQEPVEALHTL